MALITGSTGALTKVCHPMPSAISHATTIAAMPTSEPCRGISLPKAVITTADSNGRATTTQA
jgi:hypothetical protein